MLVRHCTLLCFMLLFLETKAQTRTFDIFSFTPPAGWTKDSNNSALSYSFVDPKKKSWCQVTMYRSTASKGSVDADFDSEWNELVKKSVSVTAGPQKEPLQEHDGWKILAAGAKATFNGNEMMLVHTMASGYNSCASIVSKTNSADFIDDIENFIASVQLNKPVDPPVVKEKEKPVSPATTSNSAPKTNFKFTSTNFDDGWTSHEREDWVEVTKGSITVLLHYPREGTVFPADPDKLTTAAWNILVAPRYSSLRNFKTSYINDFQMPYLGMGYATSKTTGKEVFVFLFRQGGEWVEVVTHDKNSFINQFKFDPETIQFNSDISLIAPVALMVNYNKFAIAASDFAGTWTTNFSSNTFYTNIYTGNSAGMSTFSSGEKFVFLPGQKYKWDIAMATSYGRQTKASQANNEGTFTIVNNWQIRFSNMEGKPKLFDAFFSAIKGGRIFRMNDAVNKGSGVMTAFLREK